MNLKLTLFVLITPVASTSVHCQEQIQSQEQIEAPDSAIISDINGINFISGRVSTDIYKLKLGDGQEYQIYKQGSNWRDSLSFSLYNGGGYYSDNGQADGEKTGTLVASLGNYSNSFAYPYNFQNLSFSPIVKDGATFENDEESGIYTLTLSDGTQATSSANTITKVVRPNGEILTFTRSPTFRTISSSMGYMFKIKFDSGGKLSNVVAINTSVDYCSIESIDCPSLTHDWPKILIDYTDSVPGQSSMQFVTDSHGTIYGFRSFFENNLNKSTMSVNGEDKVTYSVNPNDSSFRVVNVLRDGKQWTYDWTETAYVVPYPLGRKILKLGVTVTGPSGYSSTVVSQISDGQILENIDELGRVWRRIYDLGGRLHYLVPPEGVLNSDGVPISGFTQFDHDDRGNIIQVMKVPKASSGASSIVTSAGFDTICNNRKTCNQPNWTKDANGNRTDYTYHPNSGGIVSKMEPSAQAGGSRPLTLFEYIPRFAWLKNQGGLLVQSTDAVWMLSRTTECQTVIGGSTPACDANSNSIVTTYEYGGAGTRESLLVKGVRRVAGGVTLRTCYTYDIYNRRISETTPRANLSSCP